MKYLLSFGCTVVIVAFAPTAMAKTAAEVETIAKAVTVEIKLPKNGSVGSGVIVDRPSPKAIAIHSTQLKH
jgi:hypothetical protein